MDSRSHATLDALLAEAKDMERTLLALRQSGTARVLREMRLRLADLPAVERIATAAIALVEDVQCHVKEDDVEEDEADLDDELWKALKGAVDAWRDGSGGER